MGGGCISEGDYTHTHPNLYVITPNLIMCLFPKKAYVYVSINSKVTMYMIHTNANYIICYS